MTQDTPRRLQAEGRVRQREEADGRLVVFEETPWDAHDSGRWLIGEPVEVTR